MEVGGGKIQNWSSFFYRFPINNTFISSLDNLWHFKIRLLILLRKNIWYLPSISIFSHHSVTFHAILSDINLFENYPKSARKYRNFRLNLARTPDFATKVSVVILAFTNILHTYVSITNSSAHGDNSTLTSPLLPFATVVAERLCFHKRLSFCSRVGGGVHPPGQADTAPHGQGNCSGWNASYWNAFSFGKIFAENCNKMKKIGRGCVPFESANERAAVFFTSTLWMLHGESTSVGVGSCPSTSKVYRLYLLTDSPRWLVTYHE